MSTSCLHSPAPVRTLLLTSVVLLGACRAESGAAPSAPQPLQVSVAEVIVRPVAESAEFTGRFEAMERVAVRPRVTGYVQRVTFREGGVVKRGAVLFEIDPRPFQAEVDRLAAELARVRAQAEVARADHGRAQRLVEQNALSREEFERRAAAARATAAQVAAVEAALDAARLNLSFTRVEAPIHGRVGRALITEGNLVDSTSVLTTLVSVDPIHVLFDADEATYLRYARADRDDGALDVPSVRVGLADEDGHPHPASLDFVDNALVPGSGTIRGRAMLANPDGVFVPGLFARVKLTSPRQRPVALIDDRAVGTDLGRKFVLAVKPDNTLAYRPVTLGPMLDGLRVVREGLGAGDVIVVNGLQRVRAGATIAPKAVAMGAPSTLEQRYAQASTAAAATQVVRAPGGGAQTSHSAE